jgi:hypothetical protein
MEPDMAFVTADVVENPGGELPYKVVFKQGETVLGEWPVESQAEGEEQIVELIREAIAEDEGDDEDDDKDDD